MALRNIVTVGDNVLNKPCRPVTKFDKRLHTLLDDMADTLEQAHGAGLAAPQVGVLRRVVLVDVGDENGYFLPFAGGTRAEAAVMISRILSIIGGVQNEN